MKNVIIVSLLIWTFSYAASARLMFEKKDPNTELDTAKLIKKAGYPAEAHVVLTDDGYLLMMHRIPGKPGAPTIYLQHGIIGSSADWILNAIQGNENSLAFLLADAGYDVWLGNIRGNTYSRGHVSLSTDDLMYWNFSWHEVGIYDLPAMINYIVNMTGKPLKAYVGYSMGTTCFYVMGSERPEMLELMQSSYSLAPIAFVKHFKGFLRLLEPFSNELRLFLHVMGEGEILPQNFAIKILSKYFCSINHMEEKVCSNLMFTLTGFDNLQFNYSMMPVISTHVPAGASSKMVFHYVQEMRSGYFRQFDYGEAANMLKYNNLEPPSYDVSKIKVPHTIVCASNDWLSQPADVDQLISKLSIKPTVYKVPYENFNHVDYLFAINASKLVYEPLIRMINESN
ncbi:Lipase 3 [Anthophora quadrimaculata]